MELFIRENYKFFSERSCRSERSFYESITSKSATRCRTTAKHKDNIICNAIVKEYNGNNVLQLAQKYNYSVRSIWRILKLNK